MLRTGRATLRGVAQALEAAPAREAANFRLRQTVRARARRAAALRARLRHTLRSRLCRRGALRKAVRGALRRSRQRRGASSEGCVCALRLASARRRQPPHAAERCAAGVVGKPRVGRPHGRRHRGAVQPREAKACAGCAPAWSRAACAEHAADARSQSFWRARRPSLWARPPSAAPGS